MLVIPDLKFRQIVAATTGWPAVGVARLGIDSPSGFKNKKPFTPVHRSEGLHPVYLALEYLSGRNIFSRKVSPARWQGRSSGFPDALSAFPPWHPGAVACESTVPSRFFARGRGYSGGTAPGFHGIPY